MPFVTVIELVDSPVDHNNVPAAAVVRTEFPQLSTTLTEGVAGTATGVATPDPGALVQPATVAVTVYVFPFVTVIDDVDSPVDHNKVPVAAVVNTEFPQLSTTLTEGVAGIVKGVAVPEPGALVQPATV